MEQIDSLAVRLNILLADFADLLEELGRLRRLPLPAAAAAAALKREISSIKRNTFDELAVGGRFG